MFEKKDRRALLWTGVALAGAACLGNEAVAGNYNQAATPTTIVNYFSLSVQPGQQFFAPAGQMLIDDITYGPEIRPDFQNVPLRMPLWNVLTAPPTNPPVMTSIPDNTGTGILTTTATYWSIVNLPSSRSEGWREGRDQYFSVEMQEATNASPPVFVRAFDRTSHVFHAAMLARETTLSPGGFQRTLGFGLGISESLATLSESRHYQTPHIVPEGNMVLCAQVGMGAYATMTVYVKGRVLPMTGSWRNDVTPTITIQ